jgi:hypothetical protein
MIVNRLLRSLLTILAFAFLCSCAPTAVPATGVPTPDASPTPPATSVPPLDPSPTPPATRVPTGISSSNVEQIVLLDTLTGHSKRVLDVVFSAGGELLASSSEDMKIRLWDVSSGQEMHAFQMRSVDMADIDIFTDRNMLASGEAIWDLESMEEIHPLERGSQIPAFVAFSPDGSLLALARMDQETELWDVTSGQPVYAFPEQEEERTKEMVFSPDGALLAMGVIDGTIRLWDIESRELAGVFHYPGETDIHGITFSPDGRFLASGGRVPTVVLWDVASGEVVRTFSVRDCMTSVAFSPDGSLLAAAGGAEKAILLWDVESGELLRTLQHDDQSMAIAFSPDGSLLAVGGFDSQVYLWGLPTNPQEQ